jgi:ubiquinone/menaquinone biosynthesis C-methylase UbiE
VAQLDQLDLPDDRFDLVVGNASLVSRPRVRRMFAEMVRVAAPGATIALRCRLLRASASSFSIYWEALHNTGLIDHESTSNS